MKPDILIIGAGVAGLFTALKLAPRPVTIVTARALGKGGSSGWAQGGIAAAVAADDSPADHFADTIAAVDPDVVTMNEITPDIEAELRTHPFADLYPFRRDEPADLAAGLSV